MALHQASGRWRYGLILALITAALWATLPVALKIALERIDPWTLTWARFGFAAIVLLLWMAMRGGLRGYAGHPVRHWALLAVAGVLLVGNYLGYLLGLEYTTPANVQLLIQAAPLLMALGGIFVFGERYSRGQWLGLLAVLVGLCLFFADQIAMAIAEAHYLLGAGLVLLAALVWAGYALIQKQLLNHFSSTRVLAAIYLLAALLLWPLAAPRALLELDGIYVAALLFCALNTLGAYGAFAEALAHWEASRVSAILATTPLLTVMTVSIVHVVAPTWVAAENIAWLGWVGALLVVAGSAASSLLGKPRARAMASEPP